MTLGRIHASPRGLQLRFAHFNVGMRTKATFHQALDGSFGIFRSLISIAFVEAEENRNILHAFGIGLADGTPQHGGQKKKDQV
jgi:hypothetical protein